MMLLVIINDDNLQIKIGMVLEFFRKTRIRPQSSISEHVTINSYVLPVKLINLLSD
jgi:hypothetical protein